jgi:mannitol-1-phosphate 5-dehydrogenase
MSNATFVGFGFGAIQSGLFLTEAFNSGKFDRLVVAEVNPARVEAIRQNNGAFSVNIATATERVVQMIEGVEILNPSVPEDATRLVEALTDATEIATALPSVEFFDRGSPSVAGLLRDALRRKMSQNGPAAIVYTAENNNHAAERLEHDVFGGLNSAELASAKRHMQMLNTVIGKMSSVVVDPVQIGQLGLAPIVPGADEAFLVEAFNRILISQISLPEFDRRIEVFEEKADLLPFEEAKLYGHNAIHALLGYLANERELRTMSELAKHRELLAIGQAAFLQESGAALIRKYQGQDPLFTETGFAAYADDLLERMLNPNLQDPVERVVRDPLRKLGWNDRLIGAIRLAIAQDIQPYNLLSGARAALRCNPSGASLRLLAKQWKTEGATMIPIQLADLF